MYVSSLRQLILVHKYYFLRASRLYVYKTFYLAGFYFYWLQEHNCMEIVYSNDCGGIMRMQVVLNTEGTTTTKVQITMIQ
jgi:hypothetical protein